MDYVATAMDHLAHLEGHDGEAFHLVNPEPQSVVEMINSFCTAAGAPRFATPVDRGTTGSLPFSLVPGPLRPSRLPTGLVRSGAGRLLLEQTIGRVGIPSEVVGHTSFRPVFDSRRTEKALAGSALPSPTSSPTPARCGATGRTTSTSPRRTTRRRARR